MANPRMIAALTRIEAAAGRLERALAARPEPGPDPALVALAERHDRLRAETAAALLRLDRLLDPVAPVQD